MDFKDYYAILGVPRDADAKAIAAAYRRLARQHHPDVNRQDPAAEEKFKDINEAYQALSDPEKRARYDQIYDLRQRGGGDWEQILRGARGGWQQAPGGWSFRVEGDEFGGIGGFSEFFRQIFGQGAEPFGAAPDGQDVASTIEISLDEAFHGATRTIQIGQDGQARTIDVTIPKGIDTGRRLRLRGQGARGRRGGAGDLYLEVVVAPHPVFERRGDDLYVEVPVSIAEAALGGEIEVPTLEGRVTMTVPPGTQGGQQFRLRGQGMPRLNGAGRGDLFVRAKVAVPRTLGPRERELFEELRRLRPENPRAGMGLK